MPIHSMQAAAALVVAVVVEVEAVPRLPNHLPFGRQQPVFPGSSTFNSEPFYSVLFSCRPVVVPLEVSVLLVVVVFASMNQSKFI